MVIEDTVQWTIIKFTDDGIIAIKKLNDLRSNEGHDEEELEEGDLCLAKYDDNEYYSAKILLITDDKEKALREKKVFLEIQKADKNNNSTTKKTVAVKQKAQQKKSKIPEGQIKKSGGKKVEQGEQPQEKKKKQKKKIETKTDLEENDEMKKKKKELAALEKRKREATAVSAQERATKLFASCSNLTVDSHVSSQTVTLQRWVRIKENKNGIITPKQGPECSWQNITLPTQLTLALRKGTNRWLLGPQ